MNYQAVKYRNVWCIYCTTSRTYHFLVQGRRANELKAEELNNGTRIKIHHNKNEKHGGNNRK